MTATLFDCPECDDRRARIGDLEAEVAWLRARRRDDGKCDRCGVIAFSGFTEMFGHKVPICHECWRPGDILDLGGGAMFVHVGDPDLTFSQRTLSGDPLALTIRPVGLRMWPTPGQPDRLYASAVRHDESGAEHPASGVHWRCDAVILAQTILHNREPAR